MHHRQHQQGNEEPELCPRVGDGLVEEDEFQQEILVEQGGEIVAHAVAVHVAHDEIKDDVEPESDDEVFQCAGDEAFGLGHLSVPVGVVHEVARDEEEHGYRQTEQGVEVVVLLGYVDEDDKETEEIFEQIEVDVAGFLLHEVVLSRIKLQYVEMPKGYFYEP